MHISLLTSALLRFGSHKQTALKAVNVLHMKFYIPVHVKMHTTYCFNSHSSTNCPLTFPQFVPVHVQNFTLPVISLFGGWVTASSSSILSNFFPGSSISLRFFSLKSLPNIASNTGDHIARIARFAHSRLPSTTNAMSAKDHCCVKSTCFALLDEASFDIVL